MKHPRPPYIISLLLSSGILVAAAGFNVNTITPQPLFTDLDQFVLVAEKEIHLADGVQVSSGDLASNGRIFVSGENIINGNLFADEIKVAGATVVNGSVSYNKLHIADNAEVLGEESTPISLPIIQLPDIPEIQPDGNDVIVENEETLNPGNFNRIEVKEGAKLTLTPGAYNLNELILRDNSKLIYSDTTTLNIRQNLKVQNKVLIAPNTNISPTALTINFSPETKSQGKNKEPKVVGSNVITIGEESFLSFKLVAPKSKVVFGGKTTFRGQVIANDIKVGKDGIFSRKDVFEKASDLTKIVEDQDVRLIVNEIVILFGEGGTISDLISIANFVDGRVTGFLPDLEIGKIEIFAQTVTELNNLVNLIKNSNNPLIDDVLPNALVF